MQNWLEVNVVEKWQEASEVYCFILSSMQNIQLPRVDAGSHIDVEVAPGLVRQYSLCQSPDSPNYQIGVLNDPNSRGGSRGIVETIGVGSTLRISVPRNHFPLNIEAEHSILIAGGIGITPILAMAEALRRQGKSFEMHYGARSQRSAAFFDRLNSGLVSGAVNYAFDEAGSTLDLKSALANPSSSVHVYVCGPAGLIEAVLATAKDLGWQDECIHREFFAAAIDSSVVNEAAQVTALRSGVTIEVGPDESIAAALIAAGVEVPVFCEQGVCGSCLTRVLDGIPDHRDQFLSDTEKSHNDQMLVCCSRAKTANLVLDL